MRTHARIQEKHNYWQFSQTNSYGFYASLKLTPPYTFPQTHIDPMGLIFTIIRIITNTCSCTCNDILRTGCVIQQRDTDIQ